MTPQPKSIPGHTMTTSLTKPLPLRLPLRRVSLDTDEEDKRCSVLDRQGKTPDYLPTTAKTQN